MPIPTIIIVTGPPASGKTTLAKKLAKSLDLPLISKDNFKVILFDTLGWKDREWSKQYGLASYAIMYHIANELLEHKHSFIFESNFKPDIDSKIFNKLAKPDSFKVIQIFCFADTGTLFDRYKTRAKTRERHPGHVDHAYIKEFDNMIRRGNYGFLKLKGLQIQFNTNKFNKTDMDKIINQIKGNF